MRVQRVVLHALFLGAFFGLLGKLFVDYGVLRPVEGPPPAAKIEIRAIGEKQTNSKGSEVWFFGAYQVADNKKISWDQLVLDPAWEARENVYVSYKAQPNAAVVPYEGPIRLDFASHPYAGIVQIKYGEKSREVDLFSEKESLKSLVIDQTPNYKGANSYVPILLLFVLAGVALATAYVVLEWKTLYEWLFYSILLTYVYLSLAAYFPGVYTNDSADQLRQAISGNYRDWHPPLMAWVWSLLIDMTGMIESMLAFHVLLMLTGAIFWARVFWCMKLKPWALFIPIFLASPIVINFSGVIWKDVGFAFSLFLACGIVGVAFVERGVSLGRSLVVVVLLAYAFGARSNGALAIFPILALLAWLIVVIRKPNISRVNAIAISMAVACLSLSALVVAVQLVSYNFIKAQKRYPIQYLQLYDIAGISSISGVDYFPEYIKGTSRHNIDRVYEGYAKSIAWGNANNLFFRGPDGSAPLIPLNTDPELQDELRTSWLEAIVDEPVAYLRHRISVVKFLMSQGYYSSEQPQSYESRKSLFDTHSVESKIPPASEFRFPGATTAKEFVSNTLLWAKGTILYVGWLWLCVLAAELLIGLAIMKHTRAGAPIAMVSASGLLYVLPYFVVAPASDFRYLYWSAVAGGVSALLIIALAIDAAYTNFGKRGSTNVNGPPLTS